MRIKLNIIIVYIVNFFLITNIFSQDYGYWIRVDSMNQKRIYHSATLLPDGRVLVTGGLYPTIPADTSVIISEVYDPSLDKWEAISPECFTGLVHEGLLLNNKDIQLNFVLWGNINWF